MYPRKKKRLITTPNDVSQKFKWHLGRIYMSIKNLLVNKKIYLSKKNLLVKKKFSKIIFKKNFFTCNLLVISFLKNLEKSGKISIFYFIFSKLLVIQCYLLDTHS